MPSASNGRPPLLSKESEARIEEKARNAVENKQAMTEEEVKVLMTEERRNEKKSKTGNPISDGKSLVPSKRSVQNLMRKLDFGTAHIQPTPVHRFVAEHDWRNAITYLWSLSAVLRPGTPNAIIPQLILNLDSFPVKCHGGSIAVKVPRNLKTRSGKRAVARKAIKSGQVFWTQCYLLLAADGDCGPVVATLRDKSITEMADLQVFGLGREPTSKGHLWVVPSTTETLFKRYFETILVPYVEGRRAHYERPDEWAVLILDGQQEQMKALEDDRILAMLAEHKFTSSRLLHRVLQLNNPEMW